MKKIKYDPEADAISINISSKKAYESMELTEHIIVDFSQSGSLVGVEMLDASHELSKLFGRKIKQEELKSMLCNLVMEKNNKYLLRFENPKKRETANLLISAYRSPVVG